MYRYTCMQAQYSSKFSEIIQNLIKESKGELQDQLFRLFDEN